jgi:hypothetical protein
MPGGDRNSTVGSSDLDFSSVKSFHEHKAMETEGTLKAAQCIDPPPEGIGRLIKDFESGVLDFCDREDDRDRFYAHAKKCRACHQAMLDHFNRTVVIPSLKEKAAALGISFEKFMVELSAAYKSGKLKF